MFAGDYYPLCALQSVMVYLSVRGDSGDPLFLFQNGYHTYHTVLTSWIRHILVRAGFLEPFLATGNRGEEVPVPIKIIYLYIIVCSLIFEFLVYLHLKEILVISRVMNSEVIISSKC